MLVIPGMAGRMGKQGKTKKEWSEQISPFYKVPFVLPKPSADSTTQFLAKQEFTSSSERKSRALCEPFLFTNTGRN